MEKLIFDILVQEMISRSSLLFLDRCGKDSVRRRDL